VRGYAAQSISPQADTLILGAPGHSTTHSPRENPTLLLNDLQSFASTQDMSIELSSIIIEE
jgi:hypothetical protein